ncbi:MAG: HemK2/MTQ2 family protein methyltransferase [Minisyncoccales bacterium]
MYEPSEDSFLIANEIKKGIKKLIKINPDLNFLEIGCGKGILLETALDSGVKKENILGVDINPEVVEYCRKKGFDVIKSDLFSELKKNSIKKFDVIVFNPPYLPLDKNEPIESRTETTGGKKGSEVINRFLKQSKKYLNEKGKIFLLTSSLTKGIDWKSWKVKKIAEKRIFFERLFVWELRAEKD